MVRELISKMKNRKGAGPSGLVSEKVASPGEARKIKDLVNQIYKSNCS